MVFRLFFCTVYWCKAILIQQSNQTYINIQKRPKAGKAKDQLIQNVKLDVISQTFAEVPLTSSYNVSCILQVLLSAGLILFHSGSNLTNTTAVCLTVS